MTKTIDRTLPAEMIDLARLALSTGLDEVDLGFEGLGADFQAPIGWSMILFRMTDPGTAQHKQEHLRITAQVGEEPSAYHPDHYPAEGMWGSAQIRQWILATPSHPDLAVSPARLGRAAETERMVQAWKLGWSASRTLGWGEKLNFERRYSHLGELPLPVSYRYGSLNWFYNSEGHPEHRDNDTEVSYDIRLSRQGFDGKWIYISDGMDTLEDGGRQIRHMSIEDAHARVAEAPPWHAEMAYYDDELEDWVL